MNKTLFLILFLSALQTAPCFAWGERGHDLVTRAAVKKLASMSGEGNSLIKPFSLRNHMLSHLSNVPDFHWRADYMSKLERDANYTTHFIGVESVYPGAKSLQDISLDYSSFAAAANAKGNQTPEQIGSAPWRILQLHNDMVSALKLAGTVASKEQKIDATNKALLAAGLMSHFVGDLANPHHTTTNYNGQLSGNTGLHAYFESDVIRELPMTLAGRVERSAGIKRLQRTVLKGYPKQEQAQILQNADQLVFALLLNSHNLVGKLHKLDDKYSILQRSTDPKTSAQRRPPEKVMNRYRSFAVERLSVGASVLAQLWILAWQQAGKPNLSEYQSYHYFLMPEFIPPNYLND